MVLFDCIKSVKIKTDHSEKIPLSPWSVFRI